MKLDYFMHNKVISLGAVAVKYLFNLKLSRIRTFSYLLTSDLKVHFKYFRCNMTKLKFITWEPFIQLIPSILKN